MNLETIKTIQYNYKGTVNLIYHADMMEHEFEAHYPGNLYCRLMALVKTRQEYERRMILSSMVYKNLGYLQEDYPKLQKRIERLIKYMKRRGLGVPNL